MNIELIKNIAIDFGAEVSKICYKGQIILEVPSCVQIEDGNEVWPLRSNFLGDFTSLCNLVHYMLSKAFPQKGLHIPHWYRVVVCIPDSATEVEMRAYRDACEQARVWQVYLIRHRDAVLLASNNEEETCRAVLGAGHAVDNVKKCPFLYH